MKLLDIQTYLDDLNRIFKDDHSIFFGKKFLITGGLGLIGSAIVDYLLFLNIFKKAGIHITIADINEKRYRETYSFYKNVDYVFYNACCDINFDIDFDYIVHCAGIASPNKYVENPVETIDSHVVGIRNILNKIKGKKTVLLYVSSSEIYGKNARSESNEKSYGVLDVDNIRSSYAISKQMCEMICKSYHYEFKNKVIIIRPGHVFGPTASHNDSRVSSLFCFNGANRKNIVLKSDGSQIRSYCYSLDCVAAILFLLVRGVFGESYNVGAKEKISISDMATFIASASNVELIRLCPTASDRKRFNPMEDSSLDSKKIESLGFKFLFSSKEGFEHTIRILREALGK